MGRVTAIDAAAKSLSCATLACEISVAYEQLVLAFGNRARLDLIPGLAQHALPLKTIGDAMHIRNVVLRLLARIESDGDAFRSAHPRFSYRERGSMAAIGHTNGVANVFGIPLSGVVAWLMWSAYYLSQMPTLGRKLRIFVEWTWGMFFPTDITHLRFSRSHDVADTA